jgi:endogenous inhibitor of DNA gyrase (YacG/DUF329 family)
MKRSRLFKCPTCKREGDWFVGPYGPFCSRRCKLVDLSKWFGEEHVLSEPLTVENLEESQANPPNEDGIGRT